jgi:hypothetical protein
VTAIVTEVEARAGTGTETETETGTVHVHSRSVLEVQRPADFPLQPVLAMIEGEAVLVAWDNRTAVQWQGVPALVGMSQTAA